MKQKKEKSTSLRNIYNKQRSLTKGSYDSLEVVEGLGT